jgi:hypothetical protein
MHKHAAQPPQCSAVIGIGDADEPLIIARRAADMLGCEARNGVHLRRADLADLFVPEPPLAAPAGALRAGVTAGTRLPG